MAKKQPEQKPKPTSPRMHRQIIKQMVTLATSGFGLVAALAWNEAIQSFVKEYIDKYLATSSGIVSRFLYAVIITIIAVAITYQLTKLANYFDPEEKS